MSLMALRCLHRVPLKILTPMSYRVSRMLADDSTKSFDPCGGKSDSSDSQKPLTVVCSSCPPPQESKERSFPDVPPCAAMPPCPPSTCPPFKDPNNPCNYVPPSSPDPDAQDLKKLKKNQCFFQSVPPDVPVYLARGSSDAIIVQLLAAVVIWCGAYGIYSCFKFTWLKS